jgi:putative ABC transport system permease protein
MIKSFWRLQRVDPGFNPDHVLTARIFLSNSTYPSAQQRAAFFQRLLQQLETVPGIQSVGAVTSLPLSGSSMNFRFAVEGQPSPQSGTNNQAQYRAVSPNYFRAMGIPLLKGRDLNDRDVADAPGVVIINETMARRLFPGEDAIGKRLTISYGKPTPREIVGIVGDVKHLKLDEPSKPEMYVSYLQHPWPFMTFVVRTTGPPDNVTSAVRNQVWNLNKDQPIDKIMTMEQILFESVAQPRLYMLLLTGFAVLAIFLAAVGVYGVMSYVASQRTHEIGIRMALGAQQSDILRLVVRQGMVNVLIGIALGLVASFALTSVLTTLLYEVRTTDPATYGLVLLLLAGVALLACYLPARRATKVDPITALRNE